MFLLFQLTSNIIYIIRVFLEKKSKQKQVEKMLKINIYSLLRLFRELYNTVISFFFQKVYKRLNFKFPVNHVQADVWKINIYWLDLCSTDELY